MTGLIARKVGMTRMMDAQGAVIPVTLLQVTQQRVTKVLNPEKNGYSGYQIGFHTKPEYRLSKPDVARLRKSDVPENFARFREFRADTPPEAGTVFDVKALAGVGSVDVRGVTKGRGFTGAVKRWGSAIGRMTHGSCYHRRTGSLGMRTSPGEVFKNKKMPGHHGAANRTVQNLKIVDIDEANNIIAVKGSVPGFPNGYVELRPSKKQQKSAKGS